jgi:hypothetical protein
MECDMLLPSWLLQLKCCTITGVCRPSPPTQPLLFYQNESASATSQTNSQFVAEHCSPCMLAAPKQIFNVYVSLNGLFSSKENVNV